mgnify:CR=1 FL=1
MEGFRSSSLSGQLIVRRAAPILATFAEAVGVVNPPVSAVETAVEPSRASASALDTGSTVLIFTDGGLGAAVVGSAGVNVFCCGGVAVGVGGASVVSSIATVIDFLKRVWLAVRRRVDVGGSSSAAVVGVTGSELEDEVVAVGERVALGVADGRRVSVGVGCSRCSEEGEPMA